MNAFFYSQLVHDFCALRIDTIIFPTAGTNTLQVQACSSSTHASTGSYLQIHFTVNPLHNELVPATEDEEAAEELSLALDPRVTQCAASCLDLLQPPGQVYYGTLDWIFHDVYLVPAPFFSIFDASGQPLSVEYAFSHFTRSTSEDARSAAEIYETQLLWQVVEHPVQGFPCYTWHVCDVHQRLSCMQDPASTTIANSLAAVNISNSGDSGDGDSSNSSYDPLYLLRVLTLLGPIVYLPISSENYVLAEQELLAHKHKAGDREYKDGAKVAQCDEKRREGVL